MKQICLGIGAYGYRSKAFCIISRDFFVCACTFRNLSVGTSSCRNAAIWAWRVAHNERRDVESPLGRASALGISLIAVSRVWAAVSVIAETAGAGLSIHLKVWERMIKLLGAINTIFPRRWK